MLCSLLFDLHLRATLGIDGKCAFIVIKKYQCCVVYIQETFEFSFQISTLGSYSLNKGLVRQKAITIVTLTGYEWCSLPAECYSVAADVNNLYPSLGLA